MEGQEKNKLERSTRATPSRFASPHLDVRDRVRDSLPRFGRHGLEVDVRESQVKGRATIISTVGAVQHSVTPGAGADLENLQRPPARESCRGGGQSKVEGAPDLAVEGGRVSAASRNLCDAFVHQKHVRGEDDRGDDQVAPGQPGRRLGGGEGRSDGKEDEEQESELRLELAGFRGTVRH